jgi:hypothetical protein
MKFSAQMMLALFCPFLLLSFLKISLPGTRTIKVFSLLKPHTSYMLRCCSDRTEFIEVHIRISKSGKSCGKWSVRQKFYIFCGGFAITATLSICEY